MSEPTEDDYAAFGAWLRGDGPEQRVAKRILAEARHSVAAYQHERQTVQRSMSEIVALYMEIDRACTEMGDGWEPDPALWMQRCGAAMAFAQCSHMVGHTLNALKLVDGRPK